MHVVTGKKKLLRIISGGQTGVDRAALDVALALGLPAGGWCPRKRLAEDGPIDARYPLCETPEADYARRTEGNVRDADATLIISPQPLTGGTRLTASLARQVSKPLLIVAPDDDEASSKIVDWLNECRPGVLNVAGPRESQSPGIYQSARLMLMKVLSIAR